MLIQKENWYFSLIRIKQCDFGHSENRFNLLILKEEQEEENRRGYHLDPFLALINDVFK